MTIEAMIGYLRGMAEMDRQNLAFMVRNNPLVKLEALRRGAFEMDNDPAVRFLTAAILVRTLRDAGVVKT